MFDLDDVHDKATNLINARDRDGSHVLLGLGLTLGFAVAATALAHISVKPRPTGGTDQPVTERPRGSLGLILPAMFSATTLSALRVWNAPARPERTRALGFWAAAQALNAVWIALRPTSRGLQIAAAMSSAGMAAAFAHEARQMDTRAGKMASPLGSGVRLANRIQPD
ncbi:MULTISPECIES: tryptophan-rich sensory protein [Brevundimonas]|jgi:tryptophan-rich sensory protein|uniref:Tryptophan-rich sensory protein n=1 Tax=Brevundimonas halotolerans TaxID=69670 RepID=A0A7W9A4J6_9CAUL|nr:MULTISPECIES: tryptophan-rich sensory protein [Brevundimonas]MAL87385.1 TspO protein [Brevundimonas sp.]MBB5661188.1 tryptophan-rich sensory protein [Brevundimonas halotolerans]HAV49595.1 TspO protein [Brevundimonas sp.]|tara:strand:+ start:100379 stop:100882 length:504 start_codon:yes stop_codon:yes gene_type:complete